MTILEQAYADLEKTCIDASHTNTLSDIFKEARDKLITNKEESEAAKAQNEIDFLSFSIHDNELHCLYSSTNDKGEIFEYPSLSRFTEATFDHLIYRQIQTKASNLRARYSHILWLSSKKKIEYAQIAVDEYLNLVRIRQEQDYANPAEFFGLKVLDALKNAFLLSMQIRYKQNELKTEILRVLKDYSFESTSSFAIRMQLIDLMLKNKSIFESSDFNDITDTCEQLIAKNSESRHATIDILEMIIEIEKKLGNDIITYERRIAGAWEMLSKEREDETNLMSAEFCKNALKIYRKIKDTEKVNELEKRFEELRKNIRLSEFEQEVDLPKWKKPRCPTSGLFRFRTNRLPGLRSARRAR